MSKPPPVRSWTEPIDGKVIAGIASCHGVQRGCVYGLAVFVLHEKTGERPVDSWMAKSAARDAAAQAEQSNDARPVARSLHPSYQPGMREMTR